MSTAWLFLWHKPWLRPTLRRFDSRFLRELVSTGWRFFIIAMGVMINSQTDNVVIAHFLGPAQVTPYSVSFRLFAYSTLIQTFAFASLWPDYTEAAARKDYDWILGMFRKNLWLSLSITVPILIVLLSAGLA